MKVDLKQNERIDELHIRGYQIIQDTSGFCFGMDAVLLSGFAHVNEGESVLDLGSGTGIIPILMEAKYPGKSYTGLEIQEDFVAMANRSCALNDISNKVKVIKGDIKEAATLFSKSSFDVITSNPPYMNSGKGLTNDHSKKAIARHEVLCTLEDVISNAAKLLKVGGRFYMVHRPHRLVDIIDYMRQYKLEPKRMRLVHSYKDSEATMVLIEGVRHGKPMIKVEEPLIVYRDVNDYTDEIFDIYGYDDEMRKELRSRHGEVK